ncbi:MAG: PD40 domain-containing protein [Anaerolineaceae bacterium]|nr:PD40 domain-containing protein [Anaerolineaceae bacterium]
MLRFTLYLLIMLLVVTFGRAEAQQTQPPQNGRIAFVSNRSGNDQIYTMNDDGTDIQQITFDGWSNIDPNWSPDGSRIAYVSRGSGILSINIIDSDGLNNTTLTNVADVDPNWSPTGDKIAFSRYTDNGSDIYIINTDGSGLTKVVDGHNAAYNIQPTWSPDGTHLLYVYNTKLSGEPRSSFKIRIVDLATGQESTIYAVNTEAGPDWSGQQQSEEILIYYNGLTGSFIVRLDDDGTTLPGIAVTTQSDPFVGTTSRYDRDPSWSPDGTQVVFSTSISGINDGDSDIYVVDIASGTMTNLTPNNDSEEIMPDWQPVFNDPPSTDAGTDPH